MTTSLSRAPVSGLLALLHWIIELISQVGELIKPEHRSDQIAAVVAISGNPAGA